MTIGGSYLATAVLWLAAVSRLWAAREKPSLITVAYAAAVVALALALTILPLAKLIDGASSPYFSDASEHVLLIACGTCLQLFLLGLRTDRASWRQIWTRIGVGAVVAGLMVVAFVIAPVQNVQTKARPLDQAYGDLNSVLVYRLIFYAYFAYVLLDNVRLCRRYALVAGNAGRSLSLRLVQWGSAIGLVFVSVRGLYVVMDLGWNVRSSGIYTVGSIAARLGAVGTALGVLAPQGVLRARDWSAALQRARRLFILWQDLAVAFPRAILPTSRPVTVRRAELRYDRMVVEIGECLRRIHLPHHDARSITADPEPLHALAAALNRSRAEWNRCTAGCKAGSLLPEATDRAHEEAVLLALATAYETQSRADPVKVGKA